MSLKSEQVNVFVRLLSSNMDFILIFLFFWSFIHTVMTTEHCNKTTNVCMVKRNGKFSICGSPQLQCEADQTIRINRTTIYRRTNWNYRCNKCGQFNKFNKWTINDDDFIKIQYQLYQSCSHQTKCTLETFPTPSDIGNKKMWYIRIDYCCIDIDDIDDVCSEMNKNITDTTMNIATHHDVMTQHSPNDQCFCLIHGDVNITLVEYTPCIYNSCEDSRTKVYIDGDEQYACGEDCEDVIYVNKAIEVIDLETNITLTNIHDYVMFWFMVASNSTEGNAFVSCNMPLTSPSPSVVSVISTATSNSASSSSNGSQASTSPSTSGSQTVTNNSKLPNTIPPEANRFPVVVVTGGVIGSIVCVVTVVIAVFMFKRARRKKGSTEKGDQNNTVQFQSTPHSTSGGVCGGVVNNAYEVSNESSFNRPLETSDDYSTSNDCVYDQPEDCIVPNTAVGQYAYGTEDNTKASSVVYANVNKPTNTHEEVTDDDTYSYAESYTNDDIEGDYSTTTGGRNVQKDTSTYDTFADFDTYSHIHAAGKDHMTPRSDDYSHLTLPTDRSRGGVTEAQMNVYNHITLNAGNQGPCTKPSEPGNYTT